MLFTQSPCSVSSVIGVEGAGVGGFGSAGGTTLITGAGGGAGAGAGPPLACPFGALLPSGLFARVEGASPAAGARAFGFGSGRFAQAMLPTATKQPPRQQ